MVSCYIDHVPSLCLSSHQEIVLDRNKMFDPLLIPGETHSILRFHIGVSLKRFPSKSPCNIDYSWMHFQIVLVRTRYFSSIAAKLDQIVRYPLITKCCMDY